MSDLVRAVVVAITGVLLVAIAGLIPNLVLPVGIVLVLLCSALAAYSPTGALMSTVVTLPYFYRPLQMSGQSLAASEILLVAAAVGFSIRFLVDSYRSGQLMPSLQLAWKAVSRSPLFWILLILTVAGAASLATVDDPAARSAGLREYRWTIIEPAVFVTLLLLVARRQESRLLLGASLAVAGTIAAGHGVLDMATGGGVVADNVRRLDGPLPHPNALALFLVRPVALLAASVVLIPRYRPYALAPLLLTGAVTIGTFSRGAMVALLAVAILLLLRSSPRVQAAIAGVVALTGAFALVVAGDRMRNALEGGSVSLRVDIWSSALAMIRDAPVLGYGPDQFFYVYAPRYILPTAWDERFTSHAHNLVLDSWIRLGLLGAIIALVAIAIVFWRVLDSREQPPDEAGRLRQVAAIALAAAIVHGLIDNGYFGHDLAMSAWLLAWITFAPDRPPGLEAER